MNEKYHISSIMFPLRGGGNGGLARDIVGSIMYRKLSGLPIRIEMYLLFDTSRNEFTEGFHYGTGKCEFDC